MDALFPLGGETLGGGRPGEDLRDEVYRAFLRDTKRRARFLIEVNAMELDGPIATFAGRDGLAMTPLAHSDGSPSVVGERVFLFGDGGWAGRPGDLLRPNRLADARIISSADIERAIPISPEAARRGEIAVGEVTLSNADGGLDALPDLYSISGRSIRIYLGEDGADFADFGLVQEVFGDHFEGDDSILRMRVQSTAGFLATPLQAHRYLGTGDQDGDASLANRALPCLFGQCRNITPVLLNRDSWIYQVHDGPIQAIDAVKERGLALTDIGLDFASYELLAAHALALGEFATCKLLGLIKVGFGLAGPAGPVTMDVRGDVASGSYSASLGDILLRLAMVRAGLDGGLLDIGSFGDLPKGRIGYYADGSASDLTVADVFDQLLGSIGGWYTTSRSKLLKVGFPNPPDDLDSWAYNFDDSQILSFGEIGREEAPRWSQGALYDRNWTVMDPADVSSAVSNAERERLISLGLFYRQKAAEARLRDRSAIAGGDLVTFFVSADDAQDVVARIMTIFKQSRRRFRLVTTRAGYLVDLQSKVRVTYGRQRLGAGRNFLVTGVRDDSRRGRVELTLWG